MNYCNLFLLSYLYFNRSNKLVAFSNKIIKSVPLVFCNIYKTCKKCLIKRDPYCGWDLNINKCIQINFNDSLTLSSNIIQQNINHKNIDLNLTCKEDDKLLLFITTTVKANIKLTTGNYFIYF